MSDTLEPVAFDLETTGLEANDHVTVVGFGLPLGARLFVNAGGREIDVRELTASLERGSDHSVRLTAHADEAPLLAAVSEFVRDSVSPREYLLTAFNGERWKNGFDLPFLRTRLHAHDIAWPFVDVPYTDLMPIFTRRFLTKQARESASDLDGIAELVLDESLSELDPFEDSAAAATAFETGEFEVLVRHNLADVLRTERLAHVAQRYCGRSDFKLKSLTPAVGDQQ